MSDLYKALRDGFSSLPDSQEAGYIRGWIDVAADDLPSGWDDGTWVRFTAGPVTDPGPMRRKTDPREWHQTPVTLVFGSLPDSQEREPDDGERERVARVIYDAMVFGRSRCVQEWGKARGDIRYVCFQHADRILATRPEPTDVRELHTIRRALTTATREDGA